MRKSDFGISFISCQNAKRLGTIKSVSEPEYSPLCESRILEIPVFPVRTQSKQNVSESEYSPLCQSRILESPVFPAKRKASRYDKKRLGSRIFTVMRKSDFGNSSFCFPVRTHSWQNVSESEYSPLCESRIWEFPVFPAKTHGTKHADSRFRLSSEVWCRT